MIRDDHQNKKGNDLNEWNIFVVQKKASHEGKCFFETN